MVACDPPLVAITSNYSRFQLCIEECLNIAISRPSLKFMDNLYRSSVSNRIQKTNERAHVGSQVKSGKYVKNASTMLECSQSKLLLNADLQSCFQKNEQKVYYVLRKAKS